MNGETCIYNFGQKRKHTIKVSDLKDYYQALKIIHKEIKKRSVKSLLDT